MDRVWRVST